MYCNVKGPFNQFDLVKIDFNCDALIYHYIRKHAIPAGNRCSQYWLHKCKNTITHTVSYVECR